MIVHFDGFEHEVEGVYTPPTPERYYDRFGEPGTPGEPANFEFESVIRFDCDVDGNEILIDATDELWDNDDFIDECINVYERDYL